MHLNKDIPNDILQGIKMVILDSDGVCIPRGTTIREYDHEDDTIYVCEFSTNMITHRLADKINTLKSKVRIVISSGRSMIYLQSMYSRILGGVDLMAENGCILLRGSYMEQLVSLPDNHFQTMGAIRNDIRTLPIKGFEPKQFILTVHSDTELPEVYDIVRRHDPDGNLRVMWNGEAFDIQSKDTSKGTGVETLLIRHSMGRSNVIAIGDRVNDKEMLDEVGVPVSADIDALPAPYYTIGNELPGEILVDYLISHIWNEEGCS